MSAKLDLSAFNKAFHKNIDYTTGKNVVSSPLGVWLALAQAASPVPANLNIRARETMERTLGTNLTDAYSSLAGLLANQPAALQLAMGAWVSAAMLNDELYQSWVKNLPEQVQSGSPIPTKEVLDRWVKESSFGILPAFPADEEKLQKADIVLANVLATKFNWREPFKAIKNTANDWQTEELLYATDKHQDVKLRQDTDGELYGIVSNYDETGVVVNAVIAANKDLPAETVIAFAEKYTHADSWQAPDQLPESSPIHTTKEIQAQRDHYTAKLPAWKANSTHDLNRMNLPLKEAVTGITDGDMAVDGVQVAAAAYNKRGFEAAAVTAIIARAAALPPRVVTRKQIDITFAHPFAVVAAQGYDYNNQDSLWENLPVFTAWVVEADQVSDKDFAVKD